MTRAGQEIHNGEITIWSPRGGHRTFRVKTQSQDATFAPGKRVVALLGGPDNESDYNPFGFVLDRADGSQYVNVWLKCRGKPGELSRWEWFARMLSEPASFEALGYRYLESRRCVRCNRLLTTPESIEAGIGPECAKRGEV